MNKNYELTINDLLVCYVLEEEWADMRSDFDISLERGPIELDEFKKLFADTCILLQKYEEENGLPKAYIKFIGEMYSITALPYFFYKDERACQLLIEAVVKKLANGEKLFENNVLTAYAKIYEEDDDEVRNEYRYNILEGDFLSLYAAMDYMQEKTGNMYYE